MSLLGPEKSWLDLIDDHLEAKETSFNAFPIRPSNAGSCGKKIGYDLLAYYNFTNLKREAIDARRSKIFDLGYAVEYHVIKQFKDYVQDKSNLKVTYTQQTVTLFRLDPVLGQESPLVEGSIDLAVKWNDATYFFDVKSTGTFFSSAFNDKWDQNIQFLDRLGSTQRLPGDSQAITKGWWVGNLRAFLEDIKEDPFLITNFIQLNLYCTSSFAKERNVSAGSIIKYCRNDSRWYEIRFKPDPSLAEEFRVKANQIYFQVMQDRSVANIPRDYSLGSKSCNYCEYLKTCWVGADKWKYSPKDPAVILDNSDQNKTLKELFVQYEEQENLSKKLKLTEQAIVTHMTNNNLHKIQLDNGDIFEIKSLKKDGLVLRRGKN